MRREFYLSSFFLVYYHYTKEELEKYAEEYNRENGRNIEVRVLKL